MADEKKLIVFILGLGLLFFYGKIICIEYGTNNAVSLQPQVIFPAADLDNAMKEFGAFVDGFILANLSTTCTFSSFFSVTGTVSLNEGALYLNLDLIFGNTAGIKSAGAIYGNNHIIEFSPSMTQLELDIDSGRTFTFDNIDVFFNGDMHINLPVKFGGNCLLHGRGNKLLLDSFGELAVLSGGNLIFEDILVTGLKDSNVRCMANDASITLIKSGLCLCNNFTFSTGSISFKEDVVFSGTNKFSYTSTMASTIESNSKLFLDYDVTFSYAPASGNKDLLEMTDKTSKLYLAGCTLHATTTGLQLIKGSLVVGSKSYLSSEATNELEGIVFGDGTSANNLFIDNYPAAYPELLSGYLVNKNVE